MTASFHIARNSAFTVVRTSEGLRTQLLTASLNNATNVQISFNREHVDLHVLEKCVSLVASLRILATICVCLHVKNPVSESVINTCVHYLDTEGEENMHLLLSLSLSHTHTHTHVVVCVCFPS
jgi:hypothetical protein